MPQQSRTAVCVPTPDTRLTIQSARELCSTLHAEGINSQQVQRQPDCADRHQHVPIPITPIAINPSHSGTFTPSR